MNVHKPLHLDCTYLELQIPVETYRIQIESFPSFLRTVIGGQQY